MHIGFVSHVSTKHLYEFLDIEGSKYVKGTDGATAPNLLIIELLKANHQITVYALTDDLADGETSTIKGRNLVIHYFPYRAKARYRALDLFKKERDLLSAKIVEDCPDILHAHWQYEYAWAALNTGIPTLVTCRDNPIKVLILYKNLYRFFRLIMSLIVFKKASYLTATSDYLAQSIRRLVFGKKIDVIPNFEPEWLFKKVVPEKRDLSSPIIIMINNGFDARKNVKVALSAFKLLKNKVRGAELHLYGHAYESGGPAYKWANDMELNNGISFNGYLEFQELMDRLNHAHILLHTALEETFGNILAESMALGVPVIGGANSGSVPWVIGEDQEGGLLIDVKNAKDICDGLEKMISSEERYLKYSIAAKKAAYSRFSANRVVNQYVCKYKEIIRDQQEK